MNAMSSSGAGGNNDNNNSNRASGYQAPNNTDAASDTDTDSSTNDNVSTNANGYKNHNGLLLKEGQNHPRVRQTARKSTGALARPSFGDQLYNLLSRLNSLEDQFEMAEVAAEDVDRRVVSNSSLGEVLSDAAEDHRVRIRTLEVMVAALQASDAENQATLAALRQLVATLRCLLERR